MRADFGLGFWEPDVEDYSPRLGGVRPLPPIPETGWKMPTDFPSLEGQGAIAIDVETCDIELKTRGPGALRGSYICGVAIGTEAGFRRYYPIRHETGDNLDPEKVMAWLRRELKRPVPKVGANLLYDLAFLNVVGVDVAGPFYDVQVAEPLLDENRLSYQLEVLAQHWLKEGKVENAMRQWLVLAFGEKNIKGNIYRAPATVVGPYAEGDVDLPLRIFELQRRELEARGLWDVFMLESKLIPMLLAMWRRGVRVDLSKAEELKGKLDERYEATLAEIKYVSGVEANIWAADSLAQVFDAAGVVYPTTEKTGKPSFRKDWLAACTHPIGKLIMEGRRLDKFRNTFVQGYILDGHVNGFIHTQFHQLKSDEGGTVSGRFSSSNPNLQNIPIRDKELGKLIRSIFVAELGRRWWKFDWCVAPDTLILTSDFEHVKADRVRPGMELIGFDENKLGHDRRQLNKTKVISVKRLIQPCYEITTNNGRVISSANHRWLAKQKWTSPYGWIETQDLKTGAMIPRVCGVWNFDNTNDGGWVAGFMDGEAHLSESALSIAQHEGECLDRLRKWLQKNDYKWTERINNYGDKANKKRHVVNVYPTGGRSVLWKLIGSTRPTRILDKLKKLTWGKALQSQTNQPDYVQRVRFIGEKEVIAIKTEHGTFIANGLASHNSQIEFRLAIHHAARMRLRGAAEVVEQYMRDPSTDYHAVVAAITNLPRSHAKNINFGIIYGLGLEALADQLGVELDVAKKMYADYMRRVPFVGRLRNAAMETAAKTGVIKTLSGRERHFEMWERNGVFLPYRFPGAKRAFTHKALNSRLQGDAADIMKTAMVQGWEAGVFEEAFLGAPHLIVHDEFDGSDDDTSGSNEALAELKHIMETCVDLMVPLKADGGTGPNWGAIE